MNRAPLWLGLACVATCAFGACTRSSGSEPTPPDEGEAGSGPGKVDGTTGAGRSGLQQDAGPGRDGGRAGNGSAGDGAGGSDASTGSAGSDASSGVDAAATDAAIEDASADARPQPACEANEYRCTGAGRERCSAEGDEWESAPCPLDMPACDDGECVLRGPTMVRVGSFYVDSTEVTVGHYLAFLDARREDTGGQPSVCSWNTSFYDGTPANPDNYPITDVDWCDARAFCSWAGKRLCGAIEGGAVANADALEPSKSQWMLACGGQGGASHPSTGDCNSTGGNGLRAVGSTLTCEGYFPGLFDLEGNAAEWIDSCATETGAADICYLVGGSHGDNQSYCTEYYDDWPRNDSADRWGFRCCSG